MTDYMREVGLDGATFYHEPCTKSDFEIIYTVALNDQIKDKLPAIEQKYNVIYESIYTADDLTGYDQWNIITLWGYVKAYDSSSAGKAAEEIAKLYSEADTRGYFTSPDRNQYTYPEIMGLKMDARDKDDTLGRISLKDFVWHSVEESNIDFYTELAKTYDPTARYVGQHNGIFADTDADLDNVTGWRDYPTSMDYPVIFYDFVTDDGKEFWVANFIVKPENGEHKGACSNYEEVYEDTPAPDGWVGFPYSRLCLWDRNDTFSEQFDIVITMDNALPHMLTSEALESAVRWTGSQTWL